MNHRVQVCCSWCLTLKLAGSSKTVMMGSLLESVAAPVVPLVASVMAPPGETGMLSRGTGSVVPFEATSAMVEVF